VIAIELSDAIPEIIRASFVETPHEEKISRSGSRL
jgi:hypothetical protein